MGDEPLTRDTHARGTRPRRPALEVHLPAAPRSLWPRLDALLDDYAPFAIEDIETDASPPRTRRVYFFSPTARDNASRAIARELGPEGVRAAPTEVPDDGWAERAQRRLRAVQIDDVIVAPPWDRPSPGQTAAHIVEIEPSMGFGTGHHASTRLAVRALLQHRTEVGRSRHLLDIGTGSGILAITAATLGASSITAIDRDADALTNARRNIARNGVGRSVRLVLADVADLTDRTHRGACDVSAADVVLANLTGAGFERHHRAIARLVKPSGLLIASGIMQAEASIVRTSLRPVLADEARLDEDEWVAFVFRRPRHTPETIG